MVLLRDVVQGSIALHAVQQVAEVEQCRLAARCGRLEAYQLRVAHDIVQPAEAHLRQVLAHLLRQEAEIVHHIFIMSPEMLAQLRVLRGHAHRASVRVALAHHHASQHDEHRCSEAELLRPQQRHGNDVAPRLELPVRLQPHLSAQPVEHQRLLRFRQADFRRDAGVTHG